MARTSSSSISSDRFLPTGREVFLLALLALVVLGGFLGYGYYANGELGFPLDDSWIHQTYARNLAERGEWSFLPGQPSAGATSPLWVLLLSIGFWLGLAPLVWTFFLGWLTLSALGVGGFLVFRTLLPDQKNWAFAAGVLLILEWHLVWAAASGMETAVFALACLCSLAFALGGREAKRSKSYWAIAGVLAGLSVWLRPEGLTLLAPLFLAILLIENDRIARKAALMSLGFGFLALFMPYLFFNYAISGSLWPNTFYAKQAEYVFLLAQPLWLRIWQQLFQPLVGAGLILLPGLFYLIIRAGKQKNWLPMLCAGWALLFLILFAIRLPVAYQHGRYAMPVIPIYFVLSLVGMVSWVRANANGIWRRRLGIAWQVGLFALALTMVVVTAPVYAKDVTFIQTEMVAMAEWIQVNTPPDALIAAHDIGALGYFTDRQLLDLAGLVSPEVIPFIRDEARLAVYLDEEGANYLVSFPSWFPELIQRAELVYQTDGVGPMLGGENLGVYRWIPPGD